MKENYLITGGAGFIGSNYAKKLISEGKNVTILDNLSRRGAEDNLKWLRSEAGGENFQFVNADIRDFKAVKNFASRQDVIVHLAAQVAVTTSVLEPREDFFVNAQGTFNVLEAARVSGRQPVFIYASTNKVYGELEDLEISEKDTRYTYKEKPFGVDENRCIDFHSPYGCSKGCGDQYVRDYARIYDIPTVVFRQSCIYGIRQFGIEDQGWVAWFVIAANKGAAITIYGDGKQVRDLLFVDDLLNAYDLAIERIDVCKGQIFNIGGGPDRSISIYKEFWPILEETLGKEIPVNFQDWRPGDQKVYISDIRKIQSLLGWKPEIEIRDGIRRLYCWISENEGLFA